MNTTVAAGQELERNGHIREYLEYYISFPHAPRFAVLLNGTWGIGKTFLVKKILEKHFAEKKDEYVYLSLYGLTSVEEIDEALMAAIYPALGWKGMKIAGRVVKSALKYTGVEIDLKPGDFLSKYKANLYVFDDLERCELKPVNKVLGYINEFVEHDGCKVLIVANEKEIDGNADYLRRREKLIGKTLEVQSSFDEALLHFTSLIDDSDAKAFVQDKAEDISAIYHQSGLHNLRIVQQTIWDFERVFRVLSENHRANDVAVTALLRMLFALSFEVKSGRIEAADLTTRMSGLVAAMARLNKDAELTRLQIAEKRYPDTDLGDSMLSDELLIDILSRGIVSEEDIRISLGRSPYFVNKEDEPAWRAVWHSLDRTDEEFNRCMVEMERQFAAREFAITGEILHVFGLRLWLSDVGVLAKSRGEVVAEGKQYVLDLYAEKRLDAIPVRDFDDFRFDGYGGLGIHEATTPEYRELFAYLKDKRRQAGVDSYPDQVAALMEELATDSALYYRRLCLTNSDDNIYYQVPVLAAIPAGTFVDLVLQQNPAHRRTILSAFKGRYEHGHLERDLPSERLWLVDVRKLFIVAATKMSAIGKFRIEKMVEWYIDPFLKPQMDEGVEAP